MKYVVTGSLGNISKPLTKQLVQKGHEVIVISSKQDKKKNIESLGAAAAIGSVEDAGFLAATFAGADGIYLMVPPDYTAPDSRAYYQKIGNAYVNAIQKSQVKRVVLLSSIGADLDRGTGFILGSHDMENLLGKLGNVAITYIRAAYFYTNLYGFADMIKHAGMIGTNYGGQDKFPMVHPNDIAVAVAEELEKPGAGSKVRYVASIDVTANEVAGILGAAIGKPDLKWMTFTDEQTSDALSKAGMPPNIVANFVEMGASMHSGALRKDYDLHKPAVMGKEKLEDFVKEFAKAF